MLSREELLEIGPDYLNMLHWDNINPSFDYVNKTYDVKNLSVGDLIHSAWYVDFDKLNTEEENIPLVFREMIVTKVYPDTSYSYKYEDFNTKFISWNELVDTYYDRLNARRYTLDTYQMYRAMMDYEDGFDTSFDVPFYRDHEGGTVNVYVVCSCGDVGLEYINTNNHKSSIYIERDMIENLKTLLEFHEISEDIGIDYKKLVKKFRKVNK